VALTADKKFVERALGWRNFPVAAGVKIHNNAIVALNATGFLKPAGGATGLPADVVVGVAYGACDNTGGIDGAKRLDTRSDTARPHKSGTGADLITRVNIGKACYAVDDEIVALTDGTATLARAGKIHDVTEDGQVWVHFDQ
jgi:hypothetical protein